MDNDERKIARNAFYTLAEVATIFDRKEMTVLSWARRGVIPAHKMHNRWRFLKVEIDEILDSMLNE